MKSARPKSRVGTCRTNLLLECFLHFDGPSFRMRGTDPDGTSCTCVSEHYVGHGTRGEAISAVLESHHGGEPEEAARASDIMDPRAMLDGKRMAPVDMDIAAADL